MQTCETCRHWRAPLLGEAEGATAADEAGYGLCVLLSNNFHGDFDVVAYAWKASDGVKAEMQTKRYFGCGLHEPDSEAIQEDDGA